MEEEEEEEECETREDDPCVGAAVAPLPPAKVFHGDDAKHRDFNGGKHGGGKSSVSLAAGRYENLMSGPNRSCPIM